MDILDFEQEFQCALSFEGDNEQDKNEMTVQYERVDCYGKDVKIVETFTTCRGVLEDVALGLEAMAKKIRDYLEY